MSQAITESTRFALQQRAREVLGEQEGDTLMAHLPPVGWADVATRKDIESLRVEMSKDMEILGHRLDAKLERGLRRQTLWIVSVLFAQSGLLAWLLDRAMS